MKKVLTFLFVLTFVFYLSSISTFAQGRGSSHGPAVTGGHAPDINQSSDHGKSADHANTSHEHTNATNATFVDRINKNPQLSQRLNDLLPKADSLPLNTPAWTLETASAGFKNQGQFIAFLHVSHNLGLTYDQWDAMRKGMASGESLGKCIHEVKPELTQTQVTVAVEQAETQAKEDAKIKPQKIS
jgi:hypothetical protein